MDEIEMAHRARMRAEAELEEAQDALVEHQSWAEELAAVASEDEPLGEALARCIDALNEVQHYRDEAELAAELDAAREEIEALKAERRSLMDGMAKGRELAEATQARLQEARLELRRLRAAEAPGTDDGALEGTGWRASLSSSVGWSRGIAGPSIVRVSLGWEVLKAPPGGAYPLVSGGLFDLALDAMRAAVPGSV